MKSLIIALSLFGSYAYGAVTPVLPYVQSGPVESTVNDANWAVTAVSIDTWANSVTFNFRSGTATIVSSHTTAFTVDPNGTSLTVTYTLGGTPVATTSTGKSWVLTTPEITAVNNIISGGMQAVQNPAESDSVTNNVFGTGATNVPWTSGDF